MRILNLYAGIGGNRYYWSNCEITAVEINPEISEVYQALFPNDRVIVGDAHQYLEDHFSEYDFIWASPPCPSHGQYRHNVGVLGKGYKPIIPDMTLYGEIIFLSTYFKGKWCIENVKPYYTPLIPPTFTLQRHVFWANFPVVEIDYPAEHLRTKNKISDFSAAQYIEKTRIKNKRQVLRNQTNPEIGLYIFEAMLEGR